MTKHIYLVAFTLLALTQPLLATETTQEVWAHHINAWNARDLDGIVADYTDDSVAIMNNRTYKGLKEIRLLFIDLFKTFDRAKEHRIDPAIVTGKIVYITWRANIDGIAFPLGTDTFVIEDGKILYQTITSNPRLF